VRRRRGRRVFEPWLEALEWRWCPVTSDLGSALPDFVAPAHQSLLADDHGGPAQVSVDTGAGVATGSDVAGAYPGISSTGWIPPDDNLAVSPTLVVEAVNETLGFFNKDGTSASTGGQHTLALTTLFPGAADSSVFDPRITFDPANGGHFLLVAAEQSASADAAYVDIAASTDSSPGATVSSWYTYRVNVLTNQGGSDYWLDSPGLGFDSAALYVTGNLFSFSSTSFGGDELLTFDKNAMETGALAGSGSGTPALLTPANSELISDGGSIQPAITIGPARAEYMIEDWDSTDVRVHAVTNPLASGGLSRTTALVSVPTYGLHVPDAPQLGSSSLIATNDTRILNVVAANGSLWAAHTFENQTGGEDKATARWYQITPGSWPASGSPSLVRSGNIDPGPGISTFIPSIAVDAAGDVAVGYAESSATMYPSAYVATIPEDGSAGTTTLLRAGQTPDNTGRWGTCSGTVVDPSSNDLFWAVGESTLSGGGWGTWWAPVHVSDYFQISAPTGVAAGVPFTITVTALTPSRTVDTGFTDPVHLSSGDPLAVLPGDYSFTASDQGAHSFTVTLKTVGTPTITATDPSTPSISGQATGIPVGGGPWDSYAHDPQHTGLSTVAAQPLQYIEWHAPVDLQRQYDGSELLIHYGSPLVTQANTVVFPVKIGAFRGFEVQGRDGATGQLKWTLNTDYILPPWSYWDWVPSVSPVLSPTGRLYYPGAGGTVYSTNTPDATGTLATEQLAFYGIANYSHSAFDSTVFINTPITTDSAGDLFFGFLVVGSAPLGLQSGIARIGADGVGTWVAASTAAGGDSGITQVVENCAPALSIDEKTLYIAVSGGNGGRGDLVALDSTTLMPLAQVALKDPETGNDAVLSNDGTASPTIGPDGDVYYGVLENPGDSNNDRGWLLDFSGDLSQTKLPGAFGWDDTPSIVPVSMVPSYHGTSSYLLMVKYNNYAGFGTGDGVNRLAILDPNSAMTDPISGATVMNEVLTIVGPTPDDGSDATFPNAVREWCINSAAIDPATNSVLAGNEDGKLYRWDLTTNTFTQVVTLTSGLGEAYTPTLIGVDGTVYAINNGTLFAVGNTNPPATGLFDGGFEAPAVGTGSFDSFQYDPMGAPWSYSGNAGVAGNGSGFTAGNPNAAEGTQVAFLQMTGSFTQVVAVLAAGSYQLSFDAAQRGNWQASQQDFQVLVDGSVVGTFIPSGTSYASYTSVVFTVAASSHAITFQGLDTAGGDNTAFLDDVQLTQVTMAPTVATPATASPDAVAGTTTALSVLGADPSYAESALSYTWATITAPAGATAPTFSANGSNAAKQTTVTFHQAGTYTFGVTIADPGSFDTTSSVTVTVAQTVTAITVTPASITVADAATQSFTASAFDQFGQALVSQPALLWSVASGGVGGTVAATGLYTAPATGTGSDTVRASSGTVSSTAAVTVSAADTGLSDGGFEAPAVGTGSFDSFLYDPTGAPWSYSGNAGVAGNGSGFTAGNPNAPEGTQVGFLQGTGSFSQVVAGLAAGSYQLSFDAAQRGNWQASQQDFQVLVDGSVVGTFIPSGTNYGTYTTTALTVAAGSHTIAFQGLDTAGGDNTAFVDDVQLTQVTAAPTVTTPATASPDTVAGSTTALSVLGADPSYAESALTYTWATTTAPAGATAPSFSANSSNAAKQTTVTFDQAGTYTFQVTIADPASCTATTSVTVTVAQTVTAITVAPASITVADAATQSFTATTFDQFGQALVSQPALLWSVDAGGIGGTVAATGLYTAPATGTGTGTDTVRASSGAVSGTAAVNVVAATTGLVDGGFEAPVVGTGSFDSFQYAPTGAPWSYSGSAGVAGNGSGFTAGNPNAPEGTQVAFLQMTGSFTQVVAGLAAGSYELTFDAAQRGNWQASQQDFRVLVDGSVVGTFTPSGTTYATYTTAAFTVAAGAHTITFQGLDSAGGDNTAFVDAVQLTQVS
jgi:hypothetical protein